MGITRKMGFSCIFLLLLCFISELNCASIHAKPNNKPVNKPLDPAFNNAGKTPGTEIWRIENFKPVVYPKKDYGKFYTGDSYIILNTEEKQKVKSWDIYFWLGSETTADEAGAAAIYTVQLDDYLKGLPVQHREVQHQESDQFKKLFPSLSYKSGGVNSGFNHVDRDKHETKLYQVKGKKNIKVEQVPINIASLNKGDCFILDLGNKIFVFQGDNARRLEKLKAVSVANQIRDEDHGGRPKVIIIDTYSPETEFNDFFKALGKGSLIEIPEESAGGDDEKYEKEFDKKVSFYKLSSGLIKYKLEAINTRPIAQNMLNTNDCFVLDTAGYNVFVWQGKKCKTQERNEAMKRAEQLIKDKKYPAWTKATKVIEMGEPVGFRIYFNTWKTGSELNQRIVRK